MEKDAMIYQMTIKGFKSIHSIENLKLNPINILIGPNGSGKSNFLEVFSFLNSLVSEGKRKRQGLQNYVGREGGANRILHFGPKKTERMDFRILFKIKEKKISYKSEFHFAQDDSIILLGEVIQDMILPANYMAATIQEEIEIKKEVDNVYNYLNQFCIYQFHDTSSTSPIKKTADINDNRQLRSDSSNLAAFLFFLQERHKDSYDLIRKTVQTIAPFFHDFQLAPQRLNPDKIRLEWQHVGTDAYFDASSLSDGSLRFIALATLLLQPEELQPSTILLDEPELGLHPRAITMLASLIKQISVNKQIILATQSSLLLDHFRPEDVLVANRVDGGTTLQRLDSERLKNWLEDYSLGQLWEKNELGGCPTSEKTKTEFF